ncbi:5-methyltetrahydropteroyltriglutamate--homocysteine S-methyltransferase [Sediminibacillus dalangtanensis]|uniref:5-methyltetrahydropteroyltriglutamate--homocysteine S-methyltransferase n=1 Tax=Sediminibacillus dalangtanensis TaxID=2729421 RepID=A0ABX7VR33_9BACI|nr:5-methyltetrahydropteroyltriglutamate--homocysteine S-methyltransferase [Sediminibacillus dalangtanensis]QTM98978.1 5-methyltetrahydropteroyltriglutamate--homocysteine S-methyltransferase [Sediminibacillus dalangtanensis]
MEKNQFDQPVNVLPTPPFKGDHVGSLLRPERLKQARLQRQNGEITAEQLRNVEDEEIIRAVEKQKQAGLQAVTDGEFRRSWWHFDFLEQLDGVEAYVPESGIQFHGTKTKARGIKITGKVNFSEHPMVEDYKFLHNIAGDHTAKMTIPSPNMLYFRGKLEYSPYEDQEVFFADLTTAYKKAIQTFYDAGCRYLQLDDTSWSLFFSEDGRARIRENGQDPDELSRFFARCINESIADKPDDLIITMHICRGNYQSTWAASGGYDAVSEVIFGGLDVDGLFLEYDDDRSGGFEPLRFVNRSDLQIVLGLVTSKHGNLEDKQLIKKRIEQAAEYVDKNQLCLSPQCGFASTEEGNLLTEEEQWAKLKHIINIADEVWHS